MPRLYKVLAVLGGILLVLLLGAFITLNLYLKFVDSYEVGYKFDALTGKLTVLNRAGWHVKKPFVEKINTVDLRPFQTCINANQRVLNCKLVRFNPEGLETFIAWHGRRDYTLSFSGSSSTEAAGTFEDIMRSYAYDGNRRSYPFLTVIRELRNDDVGTPSPVVAPAPTATPATQGAR